MEPQGEKDVECWGVNIHVDGGAAWDVTREDCPYPQLELEASEDGLGGFSKLWKDLGQKEGRCLGTDCLQEWGQ